MRIVIDLQGAQSSGSRNRGIGRYTLSLAQAIIRNKGSHEVLIVLNGLFSDTIEPIRILFDDLLPQENICVWHAVGPVCHIDPANNWRRKTAELSRESFLAMLSPDILYITSLFEGLSDDAVTSIGLLSQNIPTAVTLYDLIPLINRSPYLDNPAVESWYENKLDQIRRSGLLLAISESSRQEGIDYLGFPAERSINVGTAADPQFKRINITSEIECDVRERYRLLKPFIMYTGGIDHRKNIEGLIRAYALLPKPLRLKHQLAIVCSVHDDTRRLLADLAAKQGLVADEVILTGFVPENDLIALYHMCKAFIFPSWHEGFGLPALEAMCCGAAVIAANTSSLPEVIGKQDALFDPHDDHEIAQKIQQVLTDDSFREKLIQHGLEQVKKFSWDESAKLTIGAFEKFHAENLNTQKSLSQPISRPKLAYVSPLPPERTGIADYSEELLSQLTRYYDIDVIVAQEAITSTWIRENCQVKTSLWFSSHGHLYDRVLYHFGNSPYHQHMFDLLARIPGVVVLHDFFLSGIVHHMEANGYVPNSWTRELYYAHGYKAIQERHATKDTADVVWRYPCNKTVLENAQGVIVHSESSQLLAGKWLGETFAKDWSVIPLLRTPAIKVGRAAARLALGLQEDIFMVCSFGLLSPNKLNVCLLKAWLASPLSKDKQCHLVFVGENHVGDYGAELIATIRNSGFSDRICITGWTDAAQFRQYLSAADLGVQLRTMSRGETSAAVLDCMNYGLPTIVNANGSMADLPNDAVFMLDDVFEDIDLIRALEVLWTDKKRRRCLGERARQIVHTKHLPRTCANQYALVIERNYELGKSDRIGLINAIGKIEGRSADEQEWLLLSRSIAQNNQQFAKKQLLLDISVLVQSDAKSGIQRVVRSILSELLANPPAGYSVEPVYALPDGPYRYARRFTLGFLNCTDSALVDDPIDVANGDIYLCLDLTHHIALAQVEFYAYMKLVGVQVNFIVYDLLPVLMPYRFPDGVHSLHARWLDLIARSDGVLCISRAVADEMAEWLTVFGPARSRPLNIGWFHLGADVAESVPTKGLPSDVGHVLRTLSARPTFLSVGTIEPRKGQMQTLTAFELLWAKGVDVNLVLVGKHGWNVDLLGEMLRNHPASNRRLFWLDGISDEYLEKIYAASSCLIAASEGEGFGLPLIEAAQHKLPIIARDILVFREIVGKHAFYFTGLTPDALANGIQAWMVLDKADLAPQSVTMPWLTWKQSTQNLLDVILGAQWYRQWVPDDVHRYWGGDSRLSTQVGRRTGRDIVSTQKAGYLIFGPYISLVAGHYIVKIRGELSDNGIARPRMDVAIDKGQKIIGEFIVGKVEQNGYIASLEILLSNSCTDLEIRIWVNNDIDLKVSMISIEPSHVAKNSDGAALEKQAPSIDSNCATTNKSPLKVLA